jgi:putative ABC transport system substrate-binding protein
MQRREFLTLLGGGAAAWPLAAHAQQQALPVIGYLDAGSAEQAVNLVAAFRKGLSEVGYVEGRNVAIEFRWANNENAHLPELAADLVRRQVAMIVTPQSTASVAAAKAATTTIPIVFGTGADPVQAGLVASLNRPGGNVTGISFMNVELAAKRLGLLHELLPGATRFAALVNPNNPLIADPFIADVQSAASTIGGQVEVFTATSNRDIDRSFASLVQGRAEGLLIAPDTLLFNSRVQLATLAARHAVPAVYPNREFAEVGGLMSYGTRLADAYRQTGIYAGRILKGAKPGDLPVMRATKFELVINLQTARAIGLTVSPDLLSIADEVIE